MHRDLQGEYVTVSSVGERVRAFVPSPLPPYPPIEWSPALRESFDQAHLALGRLDSVSTLIPDTALFLYMYVRKEAVLSSMIEGTQSSISDLLLYELEQEPGVPLDDVVEVSNYVAALYHGLRRIRGGFPLSLRLLREIHKILLAGGRGENQTPGDFRRSQNWIGGTRPGNAVFVPPPPAQVTECMGDLERFLHDDPHPTPTLLKAALSHVQFETIHPFLDGNGRLGRILITLLLCSEGVQREPMLYLSLYFKSHRQTYYRLLDNVRTSGDWESWLDFFAEGVIVTATEALETAQRLHDLAQTDNNRIDALGRAAPSAKTVHRELVRHPIATSNWMVERTGLTPATVNRALSHLENMGVIRELTGGRRNRIFSYSSWIDVLNDGTD